MIRTRLAALAITDPNAPATKGDLDAYEKRLLWYAAGSVVGGALLSYLLGKYWDRKGL